jgi:hypothetical protein
MAYISDHAVLRWLERVRGIDIEAVRREMMSPAIDTAAAFGCDTVKMGNGARLKLNGDVVSTVFAKEDRR